MATIDDFQKIDIRVGKIVKVEDFPEARKPSCRLTIDFGEEIGVRKSAAQLVDPSIVLRVDTEFIECVGLYTKEELEGKLVLGVVNLAPRQIGPFVSEVRTLGVPDENHHCILVVPDKKAPLGSKLY